MNDEAEVVVLTDSVKEATFNTLKQSLNNAADVAELASVIRVGI